jgi:hypothetical protein
LDTNFGSSKPNLAARLAKNSPENRSSHGCDGPRAPASSCTNGCPGAEGERAVSSATQTTGDRPGGESSPAGEDVRLSKEQRASRPASRVGCCSYSSDSAARDACDVPPKSAGFVGAGVSAWAPARRPFRSSGARLPRGSHPGASDKRLAALGPATLVASARWRAPTGADLWRALAHCGVVGTRSSGARCAASLSRAGTGGRCRRRLYRSSRGTCDATTRQVERGSRPRR